MLAAALAVMPTLATVLATGGDRNPAPDGPTLNVVGACPEAGEVRRLLAPLVSGDEARVPVSVQDRGPRFRIAVRESATMLDDPGRDCGARARLAAGIAATVLQGRHVAFGPPTWTVEKGLVFDLAAAGGAAAWSPGAEIRGAYGSRPWSLVGAAGARGPVELPLGNGWRAELLRFPLDVGARLTRHSSRFRPWLVVGGSVIVTGIIGQELVQTERDWRFAVGALAMGGATLRLFERIGVAAAVSVRWQPRYQLHVAPVGRVGETPAWWFGLSLSYTIDGKGSTPP
jgi:hypothetical protein